MQFPIVNTVWSTANGDKLVFDMARVSVRNPVEKSPSQLLNYLIEHKHWSPFQMANLCVEVWTPRDISRQILRHQSVSGFQEFSQRYAEVDPDMFIKRECRLEHPTNRQMSLPCTDAGIADLWEDIQADTITRTIQNYQKARQAGIAKEVCRVILPEGLTLSRMYMNASVRTWIHFLQVRTDDDTVQKEHVQTARAILPHFAVAFPLIHKALFETE